MKMLTAVRRKMAEWVVGNLRLVDPRLYEALNQGRESHSGQVVSIDSAMQLSAVWSCVRLISETVATLPLAVYTTDELDRKKVAKTHVLYPILHDQPNYDMTAAEYWECSLACVCLWGNSYSHKKYSPEGRLLALDPMRPDWMNPFRGRNGAIVYRYHDPDERDGYRDYSEEEIFHIKGFGVTGVKGLSPIHYARHSLGNAMAIEESVGSTFKNMARPSGVLVTDQLLTKAQQDQYLKPLAEDFSGTINAGKIMPLMAGFKFQPISMPPEDAQMLQSRGFSVEEICRWFRVPPHMIGHTEKVTSWGSGLEQMNLGFLTYALRPYLTRIEQAVRKSLIAPHEVGRVHAEFNLEGLLRADSAGRAALYAQMSQNGIYTRNEIRAKENLPPIEGGDTLTVQVNLVPIDQLGRATRPADQAPDRATPNDVQELAA